MDVTDDIETDIAEHIRLNLPEPEAAYADVLVTVMVGRRSERVRQSPGAGSSVELRGRRPLCCAAEGGTPPEWLPEGVPLRRYDACILLLNPIRDPLPSVPERRLRDLDAESDRECLGEVAWTPAVSWRAWRAVHARADHEAVRVAQVATCPGVGRLLRAEFPRP